jgi:hypothetical protein
VTAGTRAWGLLRGLWGRGEVLGLRGLFSRTSAGELFEDLSEGRSEVDLGCFWSNCRSLNGKPVEGGLGGLGTASFLDKASYFCKFVLRRSNMRWSSILDEREGLCLLFLSFFSSLFFKDEEVSGALVFSEFLRLLCEVKLKVLVTVDVSDS